MATVNQGSNIGLKNFLKEIPNFRSAMKSRSSIGGILSKLPTLRSGCAVPWWQGDKYCDDENNNADCNWDGGDCCNNNSPIWDIWCTVSPKINNKLQHETKNENTVYLESLTGKKKSLQIGYNKSWFVDF